MKWITGAASDALFVTLAPIHLCVFSGQQAVDLLVDPLGRVMHIVKAFIGLLQSLAQILDKVVHILDAQQTGESARR